MFHDASSSSATLTQTGSTATATAAALTAWYTWTGVTEATSVPSFNLVTISDASTTEAGRVVKASTSELSAVTNL